MQPGSSGSSAKVMRMRLSASMRLLRRASSSLATDGVALTILFAFLTFAVHGSAAPSATSVFKPFMLSEAVQHAALELRVAEDPQVRERGLAHYLDLLTAADIIASRRAGYARRSPERSDFFVAFAAVCVPLPNKPRLPTSLSAKIRDGLTGLYTSPARRELFSRSLRDHLLTAEPDQLIASFKGVTTLSAYEDLFFKIATPARRTP